MGEIVTWVVFFSKLFCRYLLLFIHLCCFAGLFVYLALFLLLSFFLSFSESLILLDQIQRDDLLLKL